MCILIRIYFGCFLLHVGKRKKDKRYSASRKISLCMSGKLSPGPQRVKTHVLTSYRPWDRLGWLPEWGAKNEGLGSNSQSMDCGRRPRSL